MTEPCGQCGHPIADEETVTVCPPSGGPSYRVHRRCAALLPVAEAPPQDARKEITRLEAWDAYEMAVYGKTGNTFMAEQAAAITSFLEWMLAGREPESWRDIETAPQDGLDLAPIKARACQLRSEGGGYSHDEAARLESLIAEIERVRAASCAPRTPPEGWQPIETAPKDHTEILVLHRGEYMSVVWWDETFSGWIVAALADQSIYVEPTHWMPLPPSPAEKAPTR